MKYVLIVIAFMGPEPKVYKKPQPTYEACVEAKVRLIAYAGDQWTKYAFACKVSK